MTNLERVCPRCGEEAGRDEFCSECGLHLWEQSELPTRDEWEQAGGEGAHDAPTRSGNVDPDGRSVVGWWRSLPSSREAVILVSATTVALVVLLGYGTFAAVNTGDDIPFCCGNGGGTSLQGGSTQHSKAAAPSAQPAGALTDSSSCADWLLASTGLTAGLYGCAPAGVRCALPWIYARHVQDRGLHM